jgi:hypothetical protein
MARTLQNVKTLDAPAESAQKNNLYSVGRVIRSYFDYKGNFTTAGAGGGAGTYAEDGVPRTVGNLHVKRRGESIMNCPAVLVYYLALYEDRVAPYLVTPTPTDANADFPFRMILPIPHASGDANSVASEFAQTLGISSTDNPEIVIDYGAAATMSSAGAGHTATLTAQTAGLTAVLETAGHPSKGKRLFSSATRALVAQSDFQVQLTPARARRLQRVLFLGRRASAKDDTSFSNVKIKNASNSTFFDANFARLQSENRARTKLTATGTGGIAKGVAVADFDRNGNFEDIPSMANWDDFVIELNCDAASYGATSDVGVLVVAVADPD